MKTGIAQGNTQLETLAALTIKNFASTELAPPPILQFPLYKAIVARLIQIESSVATENAQGQKIAEAQDADVVAYNTARAQQPWYRRMFSSEKEPVQAEIKPPVITINQIAELHRDLTLSAAQFAAENLVEAGVLHEKWVGAYGGTDFIGYVFSDYGRGCATKVLAGTAI